MLDNSMYRSSSRSARFVRIPNLPLFLLKKKTYGTAIPRKPTLPMAWQKKCCWYRGKLIVRNMALTLFTCYLSTFTVQETTSIRKLHMLFPPLIVLWGDGRPTREFLYVEDAAEGIVLATERYDGDEPVNLGTGEEIQIRDLANM